MNDCIVIIPTYNEIENIESIIRSVLSQHKPFHILIVDDNSPDLLQIKLSLQSDLKAFILENKEEAGLGTAYVHGFKWALENKYDFIFEMDADFSHNPNDLERYTMPVIGNADLAMVPVMLQGKCCQLAVEPCLLSYLLQLCSYYNNMKIHDATAGFICYKGRCLRTLV
jgi:dolichol-phosphate mannosyltransferase